jgi:subtilisin family serine protease
MIDGKGVVVGVIGTGVDWTHPDLQASYLGAEGHHDYTWYDPWEGSTAPVDTNGIGTHTLGTVVGAGGTGVAPGARWIACRSLARDLGNPPLYLSCMQFLLAPFPQHGSSFRDGDPARGANVVDAAWICPSWEGCDSLTLSIAIRHLADAGQMFVTGAGNDGPACGSIVSPGLSGDALTVGASGKNDLIARSSSRGPITADSSGRIKPDLLAPGVGIISDLPDGRYAEFNGTSMAASHVAGAVTLMWSANPALIGQIERTKQILEETAIFHAAPNPCGTVDGKQNNDYGYGIVDAYEAVRQAFAEPPVH